MPCCGLCCGWLRAYFLGPCHSERSWGWGILKEGDSEGGLLLFQERAKYEWKKKGSWIHASRKRTAGRTKAREKTTGKTEVEIIPKLSVFSECRSDAKNFSGLKTTNYIVRKKVEMVEVTVYALELNYKLTQLLQSHEICTQYCHWHCSLQYLGIIV